MECLINKKCILVGLLVMTMILLRGVFADCGPLYNPEEELVEPTTKTKIIWNVGNLGSVSYPNKSTALGSLAEFKCEKGFYVKGNKFAVCKEDRKWHIDHRGLKCELIECEIPSDIEHGNITYYRAVHGEHSGYSQYKVACNDGYRPKNPMIRVCLNNGTDTQKGIWSYVDESEKLIIGDTTPECITVTTEVDCNLELGILVTLCVGFIILLIICLLLVLKLRKSESQCCKKTNNHDTNSKEEEAVLINMEPQPPTVHLQGPNASTTELQPPTVLSNSGVNEPSTSTAESKPPPVLSNSGKKSNNQDTNADEEERTGLLNRQSQLPTVQLEHLDVNEPNASTTESQPPPVLSNIGVNGSSTSESQHLDALNTELESLKSDIEDYRKEKDALSVETEQLQMYIISQETTKKTKDKELAVLNAHIQTAKETLDSTENTLQLMQANSQPGTSQSHLRRGNEDLKAEIIKLEDQLKIPCLRCVKFAKDLEQEQYKNDRLVTSMVTIADTVKRLEKNAMNIKLLDGENEKKILLYVGEIKGIVKVTDTNTTSDSDATNKEPPTGTFDLDASNDDTEVVDRLSDNPGSSAAPGGIRYKEPKNPNTLYVA